MRRKAGLADLRAAAAALGAQVEDDSDGPRKVYQVVAPRGKQWSEGGTHQLRVEWDQDQPNIWRQWRDEAIADALDRLRYGLLDCPVDCECRDA